MTLRPLPILYRDVLVFRREIVGELITTAATPLTFILIFGMGLGGYLDLVDGVPYLMFLVPGLIAMTAVQSALDDAAWGLWFHRKVSGTIHEYRVNPLTTRDIVIGKILSGFFKASVKGLIVGALLVAFTGFRADLAHLPAYLLFMLLGCAIFSCVGTILGTLLDTPERLGQAIEIVVIVPLILLGGVFFPISSYPDQVRPLVALLPTTAILEGGRQALLWGTVDPGYLLVLLVTLPLIFALTVYLFDRRLSD